MIVSDAAVDAGSEQPAPASVMVTVVPEPEPVAVQLVKPLLSVIVGEAGTVNPLLKVMVIVPPVESEPAGDVVNVVVQFERAPPVCGEPLKARLVIEPPMITALEGLTVALSRLVLTLNVLAA